MTKLDELKRMVEKMNADESVKKELIKKIKTKKDKKNIDEWIKSMRDLIESYKKVGIVWIVLSQLLLFTVLLCASFTPLALLFMLYVILMPSILSSQGQIWEEGLGQFIRLVDRDILDRITRSVLIGFALLGSISLAVELDKQYKWFIISVVIIPLVLNPYASRLMYVIMSKVVEWSESGVSEDEARHIRMKQGWYWFHLPVMAIVIGGVMGTLAILGMNVFYEGVKDVGDVSMGDVMRRGVTNIKLENNT